MLIIIIIIYYFILVLARYFDFISIICLYKIIIAYALTNFLLDLMNIEVFVCFINIVYIAYKYFSLTNFSLDLKNINLTTLQFYWLYFM